MKGNLSNSSSQMAGLFFVMDNNNLEGLNSWAGELKERNFPAVIKVSEALLDESCDAVKAMSDDGFDIFGGFDKALFF